MKIKTVLTRTVSLFILAAFTTAEALAGTLTAAEVAQIENAFGITLTAQEKTDLGNVVKPDSVPAWRSAAESRIDSFRKATLTVEVEDSEGVPVPGAQVAVKLKKNAFKFGGVGTAADLSDGNGDLAAESQTAAYWKSFTTNMFNAWGGNNAFKPKITSQHADIPPLMSWAASNDIDVRAHLLMWPGGGNVADLSGTAGTDYGNHLSTASTSAYASYDVLGAVETYAASAQDAAAKAALKSVVDAEIAEWAGRWNVYEWDVINETRGNTLLQQILGYDQEVEWFNIASNNLANPAAKLYINENQIISAKSESLQSGYYTSRRDTYFTTIDRLVASNAPIHGVGFQNRYKWEHISPAEVYGRLDEFATRYPNLQLAGTEFEIKHDVGNSFTPDELTRAQMTEETMTVYYSHDQAIGLNAWDYISPSPAKTTDTNEWKSAMAWYDGTIKLNALAWYYVHRIRYNTDTNDTTDVSGLAAVAGAHKGDYEITVTYNGTDYPATVTLSSNQTVTVTLSDVTITPSENAPVFTVDPISKPNATQDTAYTGQTLSGSATDADGDTLIYSKLLGPAWLNIASDGTLSGTPTSSDTGQNSWIVQVSDGFNTDTAVLKIGVDSTGGGGGPGSNISIITTQTQGWNVPAATSGTSSYSGISVQVGDVVVLTVSGNKKGTVVPLSCTKVGGTATVGAQTERTNALATYPTAWAWFYTVTGAGTVDFDITTDNTLGITAITALYVVRAGSGIVQEADFATWDDNDNADNGTSYSLNYTFGASLPDGVLIESVNARTDLVTEPVAYTEDRNGGDKRLLLSYDGVNGSSWTSTYSLSGGTADKQTSGAVGMVFNEQTTGAGNNPPVFDSDPISEAGATQDEAYSGSTLADNASDGDLDSMTFGKVSGPSWLSVASNGALTGTPLVGDLGTNSWQVYVTDGTATNYANLQILVTEPLNLVTPQNGTNVLFIAIDDCKPVFGAYGDPIAITPNIDSFASNGVTFLNAECQWAVCGPSRASLTTSLMPEEILPGGFNKMRGDAVNTDRINDVIRPNVVTLQQWFRYNGYRTAATGKINDPRCVGTLDTATGKVAEDGGAVHDPPSWGDPVNPNSLPSDFFSNSAYVPYASGWSPAGKPSIASNDAPDSTFVDGIICNQGITLMNNLAAGDAQFFLGVGFKKPHLGFYAPQKYWDYYDRNDFSPAAFQDHPENEVAYSWNYAAELVNYDDIADVRDANGLLIVPEAKQKELIHGYYACVSHIDALIGQLLDNLETLGLADNTIVVIWGDHGFHLGDHSEWAKHTNLEQAARVPLIIYSPFTGVTGATTEAPATLMDMYPTICELAGLPVPEQPLAQNEDPFDPASGRALKGKSLVPVMEDPDSNVRVGAITVFQRLGATGYSYRSERFRYIEWVSGGSVVARELYDFVADPNETVNLAGVSGYEALMWHYSASMRKEMDDLGLSGSDIAANDLQGSPALNTTSGDLSLVGLTSSRSGTSFDIGWPRGAGWTYDVMFKTNLTDATWQPYSGGSGVSGESFTVPANKAAEFFRIEVDTHTP